jgi:hypothetical protein
MPVAIGNGGCFGRLHGGILAVHIIENGGMDQHVIECRVEHHFVVISCHLPLLWQKVFHSID